VGVTGLGGPSGTGLGLPGWGGGQREADDDDDDEEVVVVADTPSFGDAIRALRRVCARSLAEEARWLSLR
jgi:hypothetical protein